MRFGLLVGSILLLVSPAVLPAGTPPELSEGKVETPFAEPYEWFRAGGGGRYLVFFLKKSRSIAVFDLARMKIVRSIEVPTDDALAAAGLTKLMVVLKGRIERAGFALPADTLARFLIRHATANGQSGALSRRRTDATGSHSTEAIYLGKDRDEVRLRRDDGKEVSVTLEKLSQADQALVRLLSPDATKADAEEAPAADK